jgi:hypothetical protein
MGGRGGRGGGRGRGRAKGRRRRRGGALAALFCFVLMDVVVVLFGREDGEKLGRD